MEYFYCTLEELNLPFPNTLQTEIANVSLQVLKRRSFIQFVNRNMFSVTEELIQKAAQKYPEDTAFVALLFRKVQLTKTDENETPEKSSEGNTSEVKKGLDLFIQHKNIPYFLAQYHHELQLI